MNVSSVKNLNGETFSAVQDAPLTNFVQTNSANWTLPSAFVVSADGQAYKSVPNVLNGTTGYYDDLGEDAYYTKFSDIQNNVKYTFETHYNEYMKVFTVTGDTIDDKNVYIHAEYMDGDTHSFTLTSYNPSEGDIYVQLWTDAYYSGEITLSANDNILQPYAIINNLSGKLDTSAFTLSALNDASANNIVLTASLPATPDANTLYLIPEV